MELTFDIQPAATYEILTRVVTINLDVTCTRATGIGVSASAGSRSLFPVNPLAPGVPGIEIRCPGPAGERFATKWKWDTAAPTAVMSVSMSGNNEAFPGSLPAVDRATATDVEGVTFNHILCWPGAPTCSTA